MSQEHQSPTRGTWDLPESKLHINYSELKVVFLALKGFQDLFKHKQGGRPEIGLSVCPFVEKPDSVLQETGNSRLDTFQAS